MLDIEYMDTHTPLKSVHLETHNGAHFHAVAKYPSLFHVSMARVEAGRPYFFTADACDEAIEFFTLLRDDLNQKKDT